VDSLGAINVVDDFSLVFWNVIGNPLVVSEMVLVDNLYLFAEGILITIQCKQNTINYRK
jgi:hypothetical protein